MPFACTTPAVPTVLEDGPAARITRWDFAPGAVTGFHRHAWPYFVVMLVEGILVVEAGGVETAVPLGQGQSYSRPAGIEHDVKNGSPHAIAFVEIEVKDPARLVTLPA